MGSNPVRGKPLFPGAGNTTLILISNGSFQEWIQTESIFRGESEKGLMLLYLYTLRPFSLSPFIVL